MILRNFNFHLGKFSKNVHFWQNRLFQKLVLECFIYNIFLIGKKYEFFVKIIRGIYVFIFADSACIKIWEGIFGAEAGKMADFSSISNFWPPYPKNQVNLISMPGVSLGC